MYLRANMKYRMYFHYDVFGILKAEVLNSLIMKITAKENDMNDSASCTDDDKRGYQNVCKMSFISFSLAVSFIILWCLLMDSQFY